MNDVIEKFGTTFHWFSNNAWWAGTTSHDCKGPFASWDDLLLEVYGFRPTNTYGASRRTS